MANETTSTQFDEQILAYALGERVLSANLPKIVVLGLVNELEIAGSGSDTARINQWVDLGASGAGTEGTEFTTNEAVDLDSAIDLQVAEAAAIQRAVFTNFGLETMFPVRFASVADLMQSGSLEQKISVLGPRLDPMLAAVVEKREDDVCSLLDGFSNTVGTTTVDLTAEVALAAQYTLKTLEPLHEDWVYVLTPNQVHELQLAVGFNGGGLGGSVWANQGDLSFFNFRPDMPRNGFRGSFMGIPVYEYAHSLRELMNSDADVAGALMCRGVGDPRNGGQLGAIGLAQNGFIKFHIDYSAGYRGAIVVLSSDHKALEVRNTHGVTIVSDAP
jgi:hypothetical protein